MRFVYPPRLISCTCALESPKWLIIQVNMARDQVGLTNRSRVTSDKIANLIDCRFLIYLRSVILKFVRLLNSYAAETYAEIGHDPMKKLMIGN